MISTPTKAHNKRQLSGPVLRRDLVPFYSAIGSERSHRSDQPEFYLRLSYKDAVDLEAKLDEWGRLYNFARPHGAHNGKTHYGALGDKLK